ncbi:MAG TPA: RsmE family RNA methyltransferase [Kofleriaceae bacterium]|jgi:16S rRNA (uracil1498-N3)-methyltransferase|nr:RsmE family RNA methyltransferase [Kofleriaceae bacterium]
MIRIFVDPAVLVAGELVVRGDEHHYLAHVRRARPGEPVELVDGAGRRAAATIARLSAGETALIAGAPEPIAPAPPRVRALVPLIKGDRMDACIEKLVEVGVDAIVVWPAARSVARLDDARRDARLARYRAIAQAAARQSGRAQVPDVTAAASLAAALADLPAGRRLVLDPASDAGLALDPGAGDVAIASGPEGGLTPGERDQLAGFAPLGLGPRVLRADTAPVIAVALIRAATRS